jgi:hypothetical protein
MRIRSLMLAGCLMLGASAVQAQGVRFAPELAVGDDTDLGIGARVNFDLSSTFGTTGFFGVGEFIYFFPGGNVNYWEINGNLGYLIPNVHGNVKPYVGGGLNLGHASLDNCSGNCGNTDLGANLLGGINIHTRGRLMPFLEARVSLGGGDQFVFTGGLYF